VRRKPVTCNFFILARVFWLLAPFIVLTSASLTQLTYASLPHTTPGIYCLPSCDWCPLQVHTPPHFDEGSHLRCLRRQWAAIDVYLAPLRGRPQPTGPNGLINNNNNSRYILSSLLRLVRTPGIYSLLFCDWCPFQVYTLFPPVTGVHSRYILSSLL